MIAYHGKKEAKSSILKQLRAHAKADEIIKGQYWEEGKGCAVGCTIHSEDHSEYEPRFGIPQALARLEDCIFEGLPNKRAKEWPMQFMSAIKPGADLSRVQWQFLHWLLTDEKVNPGINHPLVKSAVAQCADVVWGLAQGKKLDGSAARSAESAAWSARSAWSAESAAWSAESAESAAWSAARSAARSAESAESAAWSARSAWSAESAESAAWSARSAWSAAWSAESAAYGLMADKLLALLKAAPVVSVKS